VAVSMPDFKLLDGLVLFDLRGAKVQLFDGVLAVLLGGTACSHSAFINVGSYCAADRTLLLTVFCQQVNGMGKEVTRRDAGHSRGCFVC